MQTAIPPSSMLDLLMRQRTAGEAGVRLVFSEELARPLTLTRHPYHFCAINGYSGIAAFLHQQGLSYPDFAKSIRVAAFMGAGVEGSTPWEKGFDVSPADTALLAGHAETAQLLQLIEQEVPLDWSRTQHHRFPAKFRRKVQPAVEALVSSPGFAALPGPARILIIDDVLTSMARQLVYDKLPEGCTGWECMAERESDTQRELYAAAAQLASKRKEGAVEKGEEEEEHGQLGVRYQFRVAHDARPRRRQAGLYLLLRGGVAVAAVQTARTLGIVTVSLPAAAIAGAAFLAPLPALIALVGVHASRR